MSDFVLNIEGLKVLFYSANNYLKAVESIDLQVHEGQCVAIVGESGCGKSVTGLSIMRLLQSPPAIWRASKIEFTRQNGEVVDIVKCDEKVLEKMRGFEISMIYQNPSAALNPVLTVGEQIDEVYKYHTQMNKKERYSAALQMLEKVGIPLPEQRYKQYPYELSGGMKQRILIAMAMACNPRLLIADEPTTALDVTVQAQILDLLLKLVKENNTALIMITHDLGVVRSVADYVYVMYCGKIVEQGEIDEIINNPKHPYTKGLIKSVPSPREKVSRFYQIPNNVPSPMDKPSGCYFSNRCYACEEICKTKMPRLTDCGSSHKVRCHFIGAKTSE